MSEAVQHPTEVFESWSREDSDEELLRAIKQYARDVVGQTDLDVDLDMVKEWSLNNKKRSAAFVNAYKLPLMADVGDPVDEYGGTELSSVKRFGECNIEFSRLAFEAHDTENCKDTIRHELIHVEEKQEGRRGGRSHHDWWFESRAKDLDVSGDCEQFVPYKYPFVCPSCDDQHGGRFQMCDTVKTVQNGGKRCRCGGILEVAE